MTALTILVCTATFDILRGLLGTIEVQFNTLMMCEAQQALTLRQFR